LIKTIDKGSVKKKSPRGVKPRPSASRGARRGPSHSSSASDCRYRCCRSTAAASGLAAALARRPCCRHCRNVIAAAAVAAVAVA